MHTVSRASLNTQVHFLIVMYYQAPNQSLNRQEPHVRRTKGELFQYINLYCVLTLKISFM